MSEARSMAGASAPEGACGLGPDECYYCRGTGEDPELHLSVEQKANLDAQQIGPGGCPRCRPEVASPGAIGFFKANEPEGAAPTGREPEADALIPEPFDAFVRRIAPDYADLILAELESLRSRCLELEGALREMLDWYDSRFPAGQSKQLPGLTLFSIANRARSVLAPVVREGERPDAS